MRKVDVARQLIENLREMMLDIDKIGNLMITLGLPGAYHVNTISTELDKMIRELNAYVKKVEDALKEVDSNAEGVDA